MLDKLCSTLATYFIQTPTPWNKALRQIICSLYAEQVVAATTLDSYPVTTQVIDQLSPPKLWAALRFCEVLAEDVYHGANLSPQQCVQWQYIAVQDLWLTSVTADIWTGFSRTTPQMQHLSCFALFRPLCHPI